MMFMGEEVDLSEKGMELSEEEKEEKTPEKEEKEEEELIEEEEKEKLEMGGMILVLLVILAFFSIYIYPFFLLEDTSECSSSFCVDEKRNCTEGEFISSFHGTKRFYRITKSINDCKVFVESRSDLGEEKKGMSMQCSFPMENGRVQEINNYSYCEGELAEVLES